MVMDFAQAVTWAISLLGIFSTLVFGLVKLLLSQMENRPGPTWARRPPHAWAPKPSWWHFPKTPWPSNCANTRKSPRRNM